MKKVIFLLAFALMGIAAHAQDVRATTKFPVMNGDTSWRATGLDLADYLAATTGSVTSVGLALPSIFSVSGSPVTGAGTLTGTLATQTANIVFAGPSSGGAATPTFRALVAADIPTIAASQVTGANLTAASSKVAVTGGTGAVLSAATVDVVPANITITDLAGTLSVAKGGTGLTAVGTDVSVLASNGTANVYLAPTITTSAAAIAFARNGSSLELNLPNADASNRGTVSTGSQTLAGAKTFSSLLTGSAGVVGTATASVAGLNSAGVFDSDHATITTTTTLDQTHNFVRVGTLSAGITIALPACNSTRDGWQYTIYKQGSDAFGVTIDPNSSETIGGSATKIIFGQYNSATCKCVASGTDWTFSN